MLEMTKGDMRVQVLPEYGGKIASLRFRGLELLAQRPDASAYAPAPGSVFDEHAAWGWDDVFPAMGGGSDPDHGFIWTTPMQAEAERGSITLTCGAGGWHYVKQLTLRDNGIRAVWHITNQARQRQSALWVCHCLWDARPGIRFTFPRDYDPILAGEESADTVYAACPDAVMCAKQWGVRAIGEGQCSFVLPEGQGQVVIRYNAEKLPFLGFWLSTGGWNHTRQFAFEPSTSFYDTRERAEASGTLLTLSPGETVTFSMDIQCHACKEDRRDVRA
ncbi:MAG: DUF4432 family protein [Aristaeellaceae bacterium]